MRIVLFPNLALGCSRGWTCYILVVARGTSGTETPALLYLEIFELVNQNVSARNNSVRQLHTRRWYQDSIYPKASTFYSSVSNQKMCLPEIAYPNHVRLAR